MTRTDISRSGTESTEGAALDPGGRVLLRPAGRPSLLAPAAQGTLARSLEMQDQSRDPSAEPRGLGLPHRRIEPAAPRLSPTALGLSSWRELHLRLIERLSPPSIMANTDELQR